MAPTTNMNGRQRNSLAAEIDRLDKMIDGFADALNETVAQAVKEAVGVAVKEAVQAVLTEVLTNPALQSRIPVAQVAEPAPTVTQRVGVRLKQVWQAIRGCVLGMLETAKSATQAAGTKLITGSLKVWQVSKYVQVVRHFRYQLLTAACVSVGVTLVAWQAGPQVASVLSGIGGFTTTLAVQGGLWLRRMFHATLVAGE